MKYNPFLRITFTAITVLILLQLRAFSEENVPAVAWKSGGITINDSQGKSVRQNPKITSCDDKTFVVIWEDSRNGYLDIYAQRIDKDGNLLWGDDGVPVCTAIKNQSFPEVICSSGSDVVIAWQDYREGYADIYAQKLDRNGTAQWDKDGIPVCNASVNQLVPRLISDGSGAVFVTWYDYRSGQGEDIYAQKIGSDGQIAWEKDGVPICTSEGTQWYPKIISGSMADGLGGVIIVWDDKRSGFYDIYCQRIDSKGQPVWQGNGLPICTAPENQEYSEIASDSSGFVMTWQDYRNGNADVYAQKIDSSGRLLWKTNGIPICNILGGQERPKIAGGKEVMITWEDYRNGPINSNIFAQKVSKDGEMLWGKYGVPICENKEKQENPGIISDGNEGAIIYWEDYRNPKPSVYARRVSKDGNPLWVQDGWPVCKSQDAEHAQIVSAGGVFAFAWQDRQDGNLDIHVQCIDISGNCLWNAGGLNVNANYGSVTQQKPKITEVAEKEYVIVWEDYRNGFSNIYSQKIDNEGNLLWNRDGVRVCGFSSNQTEPRIVKDGSGGAIIVWLDQRDRYLNVFAQRIDSKGKLMWNEDGTILAPFNGNQINPKVIGDGTGGSIISWLDNRNESNGLDVYAQKIDSSGSRLWKKEGVPVCNSTGLQTEQNTMSDGQGGAIITWSDFRRSLKNSDIYAQRISGSGDGLWDTNGIPICKAPDIQRNPELAGNENIIVVWEDSGSGNYDIYAQKINRDGNIGWSVDGIEICAAKYTQHDPRLAYDQEGGAIIVWEDYRNINWDIYAQRLDRNGTKLWTVSGVPICTVRSTQYSPQLIVNKDSSSIFVWEDYRTEKNYDIYATKLDPLGKYLWNSEGVILSSSVDGARDPQIVTDGENGAIVVWTDFRSGNYDIFAQRIKGE